MCPCLGTAALGLAGVTCKYITYNFYSALKNNTEAAGLSQPSLYSLALRGGAYGWQRAGPFRECHPEALWVPGFTQVHIQGNLSTGFKENRGQKRIPPPSPLLPARTGTSPLCHWTQFPSHRAGLDEGNVQICLAGGSNQALLQNPQASLMPREGALPQVCIKMSGEPNTPGSPSGLWEPCYSCGLRASFLTNVVPKAGVQVG